MNLLPENVFVWSNNNGTPEALRDFIELGEDAVGTPKGRRILAAKLTHKDAPRNAQVVFISYVDYMGSLKAYEAQSKLLVSSAGDWPRAFLHSEGEYETLNKAYTEGGEWGCGAIDALLEVFRHVGDQGPRYFQGWADTIRTQNMEPNERYVTALKAINTEINQGRGSCTIDQIIKYLEQGDYGSARDHWGYDGDKLTQYPLAYNLCRAIFGCRNHYDHDCHQPFCAV